MKETKIILARHGETEWNIEGRWQGHGDSPLTSTGQEQAKAVADYLSEFQFSVIYSSDLGRAFETAQFISDATGKKIKTDPRLRERHLGIFQGLTRSEMKERFQEEYAKHKKLGPDHVIPQGESARQRYERNTICLNEIAQNHPGEPVIIVTHGGVLDSLFRYAMGISLETPRKFKLWNAGINTFAFKNGDWELLTFGYRDHLKHTITLDDP